MRLFFAISCLLLLLGCDRAPVVKVDGETLAGKYVEDGKGAAFLGVPFAEPPQPQGCFSFLQISFKLFSRGLIPEITHTPLPFRPLVSL